MDNIRWPDYQTVKTILLAEGSELTPAEVQGLQFGLICGAHEVDVDDFHNIVMRELCVPGRPTRACQAELEKMLQALLDFLEKVYDSEELICELPLFVPKEGPMHEQANELSRWCKGFLYGMGLVQVDLTQLQSKEAQGALQDIAQISKLPPLEESVLDDNNEDDIYSIFDYLEVAAMILYFELMEDSEKVSEEHALH